MRKKFLLAAALIMIITLTACGSASGPDADTLVYGSKDYTRINPAMDELLYITACTGDWDPGYYSVMMLLAAVPSAVGLWLGTRFSARKEERSQKAVEGGRAPALPETTESSDGDK